MKKTFLIIIILLSIFLLTGCNKLEDYDIHNKEYYSVFIEQGNEVTYFIKGTDSNGDNELIRAYSKDKMYTLQDGANTVELPDTMVDFNFCGEKNLNSSFELLMMTSNNISYLYKLFNSGPYVKYKLIETNYTFKNNIRNIAYSSIEKNNEQYMFNENISLYSIKTDELNNTYLQSNNNKIMLLENIDVLNAFFMIDRFDAQYSQYPFMIISDKTAYFYVVNNEMEIIYNYKYEFNENIIDYNFCCQYINNIENMTAYFYLISGNKMYIYNSEGNEIEIINVEDNLINASINFRYSIENDDEVLNVDLIYTDVGDKVIKLIRKEIVV